VFVKECRESGIVGWEERVKNAVAHPGKFVQIPWLTVAFQL